MASTATLKDVRKLADEVSALGLPQQDIEPRTLLRPADMRRRGVLPAAAAAAAAGSAAIASESGGFGGNAAYAARLDAVAPSGQSLGRLAAQLRQSLG
ncbi:hypothetical protein HYH02_010357 [Chlamydomonas schloesseri]|uniref:Uncharacterized protein n=1 Tax=Chlamydomonas schloesseri TaxID=2026947 RepID=A0A835TB83_9CHLO|nr:hypothetical protein HYH02_010357 [Chlamydomonas schloesseri]|eukprot:KAG2440477.1 hypothetical protein HYH02_010357 [Chlamydomonas schloesseri]